MNQMITKGGDAAEVQIYQQGFLIINKTCYD